MDGFLWTVDVGLLVCAEGGLGCSRVGRAVDGGILGAIESIEGGGRMKREPKSRRSAPKGLDGFLWTVGVGFLVCVQMNWEAASKG